MYYTSSDHPALHFRAALCVMIFFMAGISVSAQSSGLLGDGTDDFIRRSQLLGKVTGSFSGTIRSFSSQQSCLDSLLPALSFTDGQINKKKWQIKAAPVSINGMYDSHHPYSWNDGAILPAKGMQALVAAGIEGRNGQFRFRLRPELLLAENLAYPGFPGEFADIIWTQYYQTLNTIDLPERFGTRKIIRLFPGQSSISYDTKSWTFSLSTENIWWGPGSRNALVMSNNAPGFLHLGVKSIRPLQTPVGSFEAEWIAGQLNGSGIVPPETNRYNAAGVRLYIPRREEYRFITGLCLTYQPKWIPGLYVGLARAAYLYHTDISGPGDLLPLDGLIGSSAEKNGKKGALGSVFARYLLPSEKAEVYFEYGRTDKSADLLNLVCENRYPRGFVAGFRKLYPVRGSTAAHIQVQAEITQLQLPTAALINQQAGWYTHPYVRQGYTQYGQSLGAGMGPGSNMQSLDVSWVKGFSRVGVLLERRVHDEDFYYRTFILTSDPTRHWVDMATQFHVDWQKEKLLLSASMTLARSLNYQWYIFQTLGYFKNGFDVLNLHGNLTATYFF
jgi:hypothetical protein